MRVGFASIYSWRPHVEHLYYLAELARKDGHEVYFFSCNGELPTCYTRELRDLRPDWQECLLCRLGSIKSYSAKNIDNIGFSEASKNSEIENFKRWASSSACTLGRFESNEELSGYEFLSLVDRISPSVAIAYNSAVDWIERHDIEALIVFNGRIDVTRAIFEAGLKKKISVISMERSWFGDGIQLLPQENCLGLKNTTRLVKQWRDKPLLVDQAKKAARLIASRFLRRNQKEWRAYNLNAELLPWPVSGSERKVLLLPGSRNEIWGHPDWDADWDHPTSAFDALIDRFGLSPKDLVLRCHPNWSENIGKNYGWRAESVYQKWAKKRGVFVINSGNSISTLDLIDQADLVVVSSGSAALESAALGTQVISVAPSRYQAAGISEDATSLDKMSSVLLIWDLNDKKLHQKRFSLMQNVLRFAYTISYRIPQYTNQVRCITPTEFLYCTKGDPSRLTRLLYSRSLDSDDFDCAQSDDNEIEIIEMMRQRRWSQLMFEDTYSSHLRPISRRLIYRPLNFVRKYLRHGDR